MQKVYVIGPEDGPFKVGISSDVRRRLTALQTGNQARLVVHLEMDADDARSLEARFHAAFSDRRLEGEWFNAPLETIEETLRNGLPIEVEAVYCTSMSAAAFVRWLSAMREVGIAKSDAECARLLGISANSVVTMKVKGADLRTALACRALLHRLSPYE